MTKLCECGCGQPVTNSENRFTYGHNLKLPNHPRNDSKGKHNPMYGKHQTEETKEKVRKTFDERGISKGEKNPFYGGEITKKAWKEGKYNNRPQPHQDWKDKKLEEIYGKEKARKTKEKMSASAVVRVKIYPEQLRKAFEASQKLFQIIGYPMSRPEVAAKVGKKVRGEKNGAWRGGVSKLPYSFGFNENLKEKIKARDGHICQLCDCSNPSKLVIHHINYDKLNLDENQLITLCRSCNVKVNTNRDYWTDYFSEIVRKKCVY